MDAWEEGGRSDQPIRRRTGRRGGRASLARQVVDRANAVSIFDVLSDFFQIDHPSEGGSYKGYCPWGFEHSDGGIDRTWRTYPATNSSYCFAGHGSLNPVRLVQVQFDLRPVQAARKILERYGLDRPRPYWERYDELVAERATRNTSPGSTANATDALIEALDFEGSWREDLILRPRFSSALEEELETLDGLSASGSDVEAIRDWFRGARERLTRLVGEMTDGGEDGDSGERSGAEGLGDGIAGG